MRRRPGPIVIWGGRVELGALSVVPGGFTCRLQSECGSRCHHALPMPKAVCPSESEESKLTRWRNCKVRRRLAASVAVSGRQWRRSAGMATTRCALAITHMP